MIPAVLILGGLLFVTMVSLFLFIKKIKPGEAGVRTGFGGIKVKKDWMYRVPILQQLQIMDLSVKKLEVVRKGKDGLICEDNIRADIEVVFYVRVNDEKSEVDGKSDFHDIKTVATQVGCEPASEIELLKQLFEAKFSEALKTVGKRLDFDELLAQRDAFRDEVFSVIGRDLNGFVLDDLAIDHLEQTPVSQLDPDNILDARGIRKVTERVAAEAVAAKQAELERDRALLALQEEHDALRRKLR